LKLFGVNYLCGKKNATCRWRNKSNSRLVATISV
jgi:hypothetical protein